MTGFFKSIFRKEPQKPEPPPLLPSQSVQPPNIEQPLNIQTASFQELSSFLLTLTGKVPLRVYIDLSKRFYDIALQDEDVSDKDRKSALKLADAAHETIEQAIPNNPDALASLRDARQSLIDSGRLFGYGSLCWKINKESISNSDIFRYAIDPKNRHLLGAYLEAVFLTGSRSELRKPFVQELIWQNSYGISNAVLILHGLAAKHDEALCNLFSKEEYDLLLRAPEDYSSARGVLVDIGLLPTSHGARPFHLTPNLTGIVASLLHDKFQETDTELEATMFSGADREILSVAARFLFLHLATSQISQIFGSASPPDLFSALKPEVAQFRALFVATYKDFYEGKLGGTPLDTTLIFVVLNADSSSHLSDEEFLGRQEFLRSGTDWLNTQRVKFLEYFRFILRALSNPMPKAESEVDKDLLKVLANVYHEKGAHSAIAENAMNFEDWIGDKQEA